MKLFCYIVVSLLNIHEIAVLSTFQNNAINGDNVWQKHGCTRALDAQTHNHSQQAPEADCQAPVAVAREGAKHCCWECYES